jgi:uncharacterized membrane protein YhaH (DUF805 family)
LGQFNRYFLETIKHKYADFKGRSTRSEYWYFVLFSLLISIVLTLIDNTVINPSLGIASQEAVQGGILSTVFALALLLPHIGVSIRRLHDIGKSGWWLLLAFIPIIGALVLLYFFVQDSHKEENLYGPNPKAMLNNN